VAPDDPAEARQLFEGLKGVAAVEPSGTDGSFHTFRLRLADDCQVGEQVAEATRQRGWALRELRRDDKTLEQVFRELTESTAEVAA